MIILCDIDHTLSDAAWRDHLINAEDWDTYHAAGKKDRPIRPLCRLVRGMAERAATIVGVTSRPEKWRRQTMDWCLRYGITLHSLLMRPEGDYRTSPELKLGLVKEYFPNWSSLKHDILVMDDRDDVCAAFRAEGFTVLQCYAGSEK